MLSRLRLRAGRVLRLCAGVLILVAAAGNADAATVQVTTSAQWPPDRTVRVGDVVTVDVTATVESPASPNDGVFTFDLDLFLTGVLPGEEPGLRAVAVRRAGLVEDMLPGSGGATFASIGLRAVHGGFLKQTVGVGGNAVLFSVDLLATEPGATLVTPGPAVEPYGFDFVLYESRADVTVVYPPGLRIDVVPEPASAVLAAVLISLALVRRRRQPIGDPTSD